jgi:hypothetical protein
MSLISFALLSAAATPTRTVSSHIECVCRALLECEQGVREASTTVSRSCRVRPSTLATPKERAGAPSDDDTLFGGFRRLGMLASASRGIRHQVTVKCWNITDSWDAQYALYSPGTSLSVTVFIPTNGTAVNVHDLP